MSEFADHTVARYLELDRETARAYHLDPQVHYDVERLRQFVDATERAMLDEHVPKQVRERVINRVVFGNAEGKNAVHVSRREQERAMAKMQMPSTAEAWKQILDPSADSVRPSEEPPASRTQWKDVTIQGSTFNVAIEEYGHSPRRPGEEPTT